MKKFFRLLLQYILATYFVITIFKGVQLPSNYIYLIASLIAVSLSAFLSSTILNFLTIKENFITSLIMTTLLSFGVFFVLQEFMPGIKLIDYTFEGINSGKLLIHSFVVTPIISMGILGFSFSFLASLIKAFEKSS
ncbi:hypothetical protein GX618_03610 [Candidatus Dojkabacteria bacterium]|uniref:Uncharacterized protein n=1 Tax=Candidatus Dojkabacteria bacterium TaxID=2099670 RepID=A0A847EUY3_9BACT|nr:hypothetical protein [Candidatus Dojkabacteria bacterium]